MTDEEKKQRFKDLTRSNIAAQMAMLGYEHDGNPKDMVEVVRCKDCIWYDQRDGQCEHHICISNTSPEWFCADGERKEK